MKKSDFDKNIKIYSIASNHYQGLSLKSILYTPIPYRIPVAFAETENSANDTEKYIKETYSKEEQEALAYNDKINTEFWNALLKLKNPSEEETVALSKKYQAKCRKLSNCQIMVIKPIIFPGKPGSEDDKNIRLHDNMEADVLQDWRKQRL